MCKFIGKSNERILRKLSKSEILKLYTIVHVFMETVKTLHFTCESKSFISIFFTWKVSACELQPFSCHDLADDILTNCQTVFSHLNVFPSRLWERFVFFAANELFLFLKKNTFHEYWLFCSRFIAFTLDLWDLCLLFFIGKQWQVEGCTILSLRSKRFRAS